VARPGTDNPRVASDTATSPVRRALTPRPQFAVRTFAPTSGAELNFSLVELSGGLSATHHRDAPALSVKQGLRRSDAG
jgi:hypothetical protein